MRVTLIHNSEAGHSPYSRGRLLGMLRDAGYEATYLAINDGLQQPLLDESSLMVIGGGDGTVRDVARTFIGQDRQVAVLPLGTANNIARFLGWEGSLEETIEGWKHAVPLSVDAGVAQGPWGKVWFFESAGLGLFAEAMPRLSEHKKRVLQSFSSTREELYFDAKGLREVLRNYQPRHWQITLDGKDLSGQYLMVEAMNISAIGPCLHLAPDADPTDGLFDLVLVLPEERTLLDQFIASTTNASTPVPQLSIHRGKRLQVRWNGSAVHADDIVWPGPAQWQQWSSGTPHTLTFHLKKQAVTFLSNRHS